MRGVFDHSPIPRRWMSMGRQPIGNRQAEMGPAVFPVVASHEVQPPAQQLRPASGKGQTEPDTTPRRGVGPMDVARDLPGGAPRLFQGARGYRAVLVNGEVTLADDRLTGRGPGQLIRCSS